MDLATFESGMDSTIVARGRDYYRAGRIGEIEEIAPGLFHAAIDGTTLYDVDVRMKGERVVSAACSCPYDRGPYCKHIAGTLLKMRDSRRDDSAGVQQDEIDSSEFPHETYDRVLAYLVERNSNQTDGSSDTRADMRPKRSEIAMSLSEACAEIESAILDFELIWDDSAYRHGGRYSFEDNDIAMRGLGAVAGNIERCVDNAQACLLCVLALGYVIDFLGHWDDSFGTASDMMERLESLLSERCHDLALESSAMLKLQVAQTLVAAAENPAYGGWGAQVSFLANAADLVSRHDDLHFVLDAVMRFEQDNSYDANKLTASHYKLLCKLGDKKSIRAFEKANALHPMFFIDKLDSAFLGHDMDTARKLLVQKTGWGKPSNPAMKHRSFTDWSLPNDVFPNGYYTYLEAVLEEQRDREGLLALYRRDVDNGRIGSETLLKLKRLSGREWPSERDKIIEEVIESGRHSSIVEEFIREDGLAEAALRYCQAEFRRPGYGYGRFSQERILRFYRLVGEAYPEETREMLMTLIEQKSLRSSGREVYREICGIIQRIQSLFGTDEARAVSNDLRQRYQRRRNLMEELDALESSW